jgi:glutamine phosphoribosylpyrophosphate amidotransferase
VAAGARSVHVRVAEPIAVLPGTDGGDVAAAKAALLSEHRTRLQSLVDALGDDLAAAGPGRRLPNLLHKR